MTMTLEQFRATRREVADLTTEHLGVEPDEFGGVRTTARLQLPRRRRQRPFRYRKDRAGGDVYLVLYNQQWLETADKLSRLEALLYEHAHGDVRAAASCAT